jgi:hypothetical protein
MNITLSQIHDWFDRFNEEFINSRARIRKHVFCGGKIELHERKFVSIILEPGVEGPLYDKEQRTRSLIKNIMDDRELICEIPAERFEKIVLGQDSIKEEDWFWNDEG